MTTPLQRNAQYDIERILVVDDDPLTTELLRARLEEPGVQIREAHDGDEALVAIGDFDPDLVFCDIMMPNKNGTEVLADLRGRGDERAFVITTAHGSGVLAIEALRSGADDYLRKPFQGPELQAVRERMAARVRLSKRTAALQHELDRELQRAAEVQATLLPTTLTPPAGFELAARLRAARAVGGDFYDWEEVVPEVYAFSLGNGMEHGLAAALRAATVRAALRALSASYAPAQAMALTERALRRDFEQSDAFMTLFHARLNSSSHRLFYVDVGHGRQFLLRANGDLEPLLAGSLPLGMLPDQPFESGNTVLEPGDALVIYSGGLAGGDLLTNESNRRLAAVVRGAGSAQEMVDRLFANAPDDTDTDQAALVLRCATQPAGGR